MCQNKGNDPLLSHCFAGPSHLTFNQVVLGFLFAMPLHFTQA